MPERRVPPRAADGRALPPAPDGLAPAARRLRDQAEALGEVLRALRLPGPPACDPAGDLAARIDARFARTVLLDEPTPLQPLPRLSAAIGAEVWIKRDDFGSLPLAGAKARKLERIVSQARAAGCDMLLTAGPGQSNTARAMAAACARAGLRARLLLRDAPDAMLEGNALLAQLAGADVERIGTPPWPEVERHARHEAATRAGVALVPMGATSTAGVAGMAAGYLELLGQLAAARVRPSAIYHASATGGIWAGLRLAAAVTGGPPPHPVAVIGDVYDDMPARYAGIHDETADALGLPLRMRAADVALDVRALDVPYGEPSDAALAALALLMRTEGVLLDYVYSGKALAALVADAAAGRPGPLVLWHSGGLPGVMPTTVQRRLAEFAARADAR